MHQRMNGQGPSDLHSNSLETSCGNASFLSGDNCHFIPGAANIVAANNTFPNSVFVCSCIVNIYDLHVSFKPIFPRIQPKATSLTRYAFEHGTSGGGILITATEPTEQQLVAADVPPRTRNVTWPALELMERGSSWG